MNHSMDAQRLDLKEYTIPVGTCIAFYLTLSTPPASLPPNHAERNKPCCNGLRPIMLTLFHVP